MEQVDRGSRKEERGAGFFIFSMLLALRFENGRHPGLYPAVGGQLSAVSIQESGLGGRKSYNALDIELRR
jgi:hypothetical protein